MTSTLISDYEWEVLRQHATTAASRECSNWPRHIVNASDLGAELMADMVAGATYTRKLINYGPKAVKSVLRQAAWRKAHATAEAYRQFHGRYLYDAHRVRALLDAGALDPEYTPDESDVHRLGSDEVADLHAAFTVIATGHREALTGRHLGTPTGLQPTNSQVHRAVKSLTYAMNNLSEERARLGRDATK